MSKKFLIFLFYFLKVSLLFSEINSIFLKDWYYCYSDKESFLEDCEWKKWSLSKIKEDRKGRNIVFLKTKLPEFDFLDPVLFFDSIDLNFEVFIDGRIVYHYGNFDQNKKVIFQGWPVHIIPLSYDWKKKDLFLKVYSIDEFEDIGIWKTQFITNRSYLYEFYLFHFFIYVIVCMMFYFAFLISLIFYLMNRKIKTILYFSLVSLCMGNYLFFSPDNKFLFLVFSYPFLFYVLENFSQYFLVIFFNLYAVNLFKISEKFLKFILDSMNYIFFILISISLVIIVFFRNKIFLSHFIINFFTLFFLIIFIAILVRKIVELEVDAIYISIGIFALLISGIFELGNYFNYFQIINTFHIGSLFFLFSNIFVLVKNYGKTFQDLEKQEKILKLKQEQIENLQSLKDNFFIQISTKITEPLEEIIFLTNQIHYSSSNKELLLRILSNYKKEIQRIKNLLSIQYKELEYKTEIISIRKFIENLYTYLFPESENKEIDINTTGISYNHFIKFDHKILISILNELFFYSSHHIFLNCKANLEENLIELEINSKNEFLYPEISDFFEPYLKLDFLDTTGLYLIKKYCELFQSTFHYAITNKEIKFSLKIPLMYLEKNLEEFLKQKDLKKRIFRKKIFTIKNDFDINKHKIMLIHENPYLIRKIYSLLEKDYYIFCTNDLELAKYQLYNHFELLILPPILYGNLLNEFIIEIRKNFDFLSLSILLITPSESLNIKYFTPLVQDIIFSNDNYFNIFEFELKVKNMIASKEYYKKYLEYLKYQTDIQTLSKLQHHFYKTQVQPKPYFSFDIKYLSAEQISGDIAEIYQISEDQYLFFIGDVTGHGLFSAFFSVFLKMIVYILIENQRDLKLEVLLSRLNNIILEFFNQQLVTCFFVFLDAKNKKLKLIRAGHLPLLYYNSKQEEYLVLKPKGKILGVKKDLEFEVTEINYHPEDRFFMLTDGMTENQNKDELEYIFYLIKQLNKEKLSIHEVSQKVFQEVILRKTNSEFLMIEDDITSLFVEFL